MAAMRRRAGTVVVLLALAAATWWLEPRLPTYDLRRVTLTLAAVAGLLLLRWAVEAILFRGMSEGEARYTLRKASGIVVGVLVAAAVLEIWVEDPQSLLVGYGVLAAGAAIAVQDVFRDFAGGVMLLVKRTYKVGDRVAVGDVVGDVIDIDLLTTTLLEIQMTGMSGQVTGGLVQVPNQRVLTATINNFTRDHSFVWDVLQVPMAYRSDWRRAADAFVDIAREETVDVRARADRELPHLMRRYYLTQVDVEPGVSFAPNDNWIDLYVRYPVLVRERGRIRRAITRRILQLLEEDPNLEIGTSSLEVSRFPDLTVHGESSSGQQER